jgi:hypothetical protein
LLCGPQIEECLLYLLHSTLERCKLATGLAAAVTGPYTTKFSKFEDVRFRLEGTENAALVAFVFTHIFLILEPEEMSVSVVCQWY